MTLKPGWSMQRTYLDKFGWPGQEGWVFTSPEGREYPVFGFWSDGEPAYPKDAVEREETA